MFRKSIVALVTPFQKGQIDFQALETLIDWHHTQGTHGLVVCASTGEAFTLSPQEQAEVIRTAVHATRGRIPLLAGTSAISTAQTVELTQQAENLGVDGVLIVTPPYIRPSQEALYQHFTTVHHETKIPIVLYNNPKRSGCLMDNETVKRLAEHPRIVALKDATNDLDRPLALRALCRDRLDLLTGEDSTVVAFLAQGGVGCISVTANIAPKLCADLHNAWQSQDCQAIHHLRDRLAPLHEAVFVEPSPAPVKYALSLLGFCQEELRAPLQPLTDRGKEKVRQALIKANLFPAKEDFPGAPPPYKEIRSCHG